MKKTKRWLGLALVLMMSAPLVGIPAVCGAEQGRAQDFKVGTYYWEDFTFPLDEVIPWEELDFIYYSFAIPDYEKQDGTLLPLHFPEKLKEMVEKAHAKDVKVLLSVGGYLYKDIYLCPILEKIAADDAKRALFVESLLALVAEYGLDGIDMDWEYPKANTAASYETLMLDLSAGLKPQGKLLTAAVMGRTDIPNGADAITDKTIAALDMVNIMCYDFKGESQHSPLSYAEQSLTFWTSRAPKEKVILGVPFYARPSWQQYRLLVEQNPANAVINFVPDPTGNKGLDNYYNGMPYMERKTMLALEKAGGIFGWEINEDAKGEYSLNSVIHRTVEGYQKGYDHRVSVVVQNKMVNFNDELGQPFLDQNNRIMIPVRKLAELMAAEVTYDNASREAKIALSGTELALPLSQNYFYRNGTKVEMDTQSVIREGRIYIPLRIFFESLGYEVKWEKETSTAYAELHKER